MSAPIKAVVSDLDGVVYRGEIPMPGAVEAIAAWKTRGVPYLFVTNNASKSSEQFAAKLNGMGVDIGPEGGDGGGEIVATGTPEQVAEVERSHTGYYLKPMLKPGKGAVAAE